MVKITREKSYQRHGRFAWKWIYTVHAPGGQLPDGRSVPTMVGDTLAWASDAAKRSIRAGDSEGPVVLDWK